jgi:hypothetical protein
MSLYYLYMFLGVELVFFFFLVISYTRDETLYQGKSYEVEYQFWLMYLLLMMNDIEYIMICDLFSRVISREKEIYWDLIKMKMRWLETNEEKQRAVLLTLLFVLILRWIEIGHSTCVFERMDKQKKKERIERFTLTLTFAVLLLHLL